MHDTNTYLELKPRPYVFFYLGKWSAVFFSDVGGSTLDSHHGFVVEYGIDRDIELGRF